MFSYLFQLHAGVPSLFAPDSGTSLVFLWRALILLCQGPVGNKTMCVIYAHSARTTQVYFSLQQRQRCYKHIAVHSDLNIVISHHFTTLGGTRTAVCANPQHVYCNIR